MSRRQTGEASRQQLVSGYDDSALQFGVQLTINCSPDPPISFFPPLPEPADQGWLHEIPGRVTPHSVRQIFPCIMVM
jgi:hypothetical protein